LNFDVPRPQTQTGSFRCAQTSALPDGFVAKNLKNSYQLSVFPGEPQLLASKRLEADN
jgi:hypothetical protein